VRGGPGFLASGVRLVFTRLVAGGASHHRGSRPVFGWSADDAYGGWLLARVGLAAPSPAPTRRHRLRNASPKRPPLGIAAATPVPGVPRWMVHLTISAQVAR
jgi:hypothetical protein